MANRLGVRFLFFCGILVFLASILYFSRYVLLETLLVHQLQTRNIPLQSFTISNISPSNLLIRDLSLGANEELRVDQIDIHWNLVDLIQGKFDVVSLNGITIWLDLSGEQPVLGSLHPLLNSPSSDKVSSRAFPLPTITNLQASINFRSAQGDLLLNLSGKMGQRGTLTQTTAIEFGINGFSMETSGQLNLTIDSTQAIQGHVAILNGAINRPDLKIAQMSGEAAFTLSAMQPRQLDAKFNLNEILLPSRQESTQQAYKQASLHLQLIENHIELAGKLLATDDIEALNIQVKANKQDNPIDFDMAMNASGLASYLPWNLINMAQPSSGKFSLKLHGAGHIPSEASQSSNSSWLEQIQFNGDAQLDLNAFSYEKKLSNLDTKLDFKIAIDNGIGQVNLTPDSIIRLGNVDWAWLTQSGLPLALSKDIAKGGTLRFSQARQNQLSQINWKLQSNHIDIATQFFASLRFAQTRADFMSSGQLELKVNQSQAVQPTFALKDLTLKIFDVNAPTLKIEQLLLSGAAHGAVDSWNGNFTVSTKIDHIDLGTLTAHKMLITIPMKASALGDSWNIALAQPGQIQLNLSDNTKQFSIKHPLRLAIPQLAFDGKKSNDDFSIKHQVDATLSPFSVWLTSQSAPIEVTIHPGKFALSGQLNKDQPYQAEGEWSGATALLPQSQIKLENIAAAISLGTKKRPLAQLTIGKLHHLATVPFFAPHSFSATINDKTKGKQHIYTLDVVGGLPNLTYFQLNAEQNLINGLGKLKFNLTPINFMAGGTQPSDLLPALAQITDMQGMIRALAHVDWSRKGIQNSGGTVVIDNLSFSHPTLKIAGLNTRVDFNKLLPISTPPQQVIHIQTVDPGIPLTNLNIIYQIESDPNHRPRIKLEDTQLVILGGVLAVEPVTIDPLSGDANITLTLNDIDLKRFFDSIEIDGLEGEGHLDGRIPIRLHDHQITIDNSRLMAKSPGILRFQSEKASQMLANTGAEMNLVLDALQDFHYSELSLTIDKSAVHDLTATLLLLGQNPAVKEGQMIRLNINLESNLDKILKAISLGYSVSNEILKDLFRQD